MKRRNLIILVVSLVVLLPAAAWFFIFRQPHAGVLDFIPVNSIACVEIHDRKQFEELIASTEWSELSAVKQVDQLSTKYQLVKKFCQADKNLSFDLSNENLFASITSVSANQTDIIFTLELNEASHFKLASYKILIDSVAVSTSDHVFERNKIYEFHFGANLIIACANIHGVMLFSTSTVLIESAISQFHKSESLAEKKEFYEVYKAAEKAKGPYFFVNLKELGNYVSNFSDNEYAGKIKSIRDYCSWIGFNLRADINGISLDGNASPFNDGGLSLLGNYSGNFDTGSDELAPGGTAILYQVNNENLTEQISSRLKDEKLNLTFFDQWAPWMSTHYAYGISGSLDANYKDKAFVVIPASDPVLAKNKLKPLVKTDTISYKNIQISVIDGGKVLAAVTGAKFNDIVYCAGLKNNLIFANNMNELVVVINSILDGQTLRFDENYIRLNDHLSSSCNNSIYFDFNNSSQITASFINAENSDIIDSVNNFGNAYSSLAMQFSNAGELFLFHGYLMKSGGGSTRQGMVWQAELDADIIAGPFEIKNAESQNQNILVQDSVNSIYMFSGGGGLIWKKPFAEKIESDINLVDFYNNGTTQLLFNTKHGIHLLNLTGDELEGFPIELTAMASSSLSMIDLGENDYNMFIACGNNNVYGFAKNGKPLTNWNPYQANQKILKLKAFKGDKTNMIAMLSSTNFTWVNENGKSVIQAKTGGNPVSNILVKGDKLLFVNESAVVQEINLNSKNTYFNQVGENLFDAQIIFNYDDTLARIYFVDEEGFHGAVVQDIALFNYPYELPVGYRTQVLQSNGATYAAFYSSMESKIFLFDGKGALISGFPVEGTSSIAFIDLSNAKTLFVFGNNNFLYGYRLE